MTMAIYAANDVAHGGHYSKYKITTKIPDLCNMIFQDLNSTRYILILFLPLVWFALSDYIRSIPRRITPEIRDRFP
jgi:hypothetical protein